MARSSTRASTPTRPSHTAQVRAETRVLVSRRDAKRFQALCLLLFAGALLGADVCGGACWGLWVLTRVWGAAVQGGILSGEGGQETQDLLLYAHTHTHTHTHTKDTDTDGGHGHRRQTGKRREKEGQRRDAH
eukprot:2030563-Rhodomonas_salina.1